MAISLSVPKGNPSGDGNASQPFRNKSDKEFHDELLALLKLDPTNSLELSRPVFFHSPSCNCNLEATEVRYDPKVGDIVLVATYRGGKDVIMPGIIPVNRRCDNLIPLSTVLNEIEDYNKTRFQNFSFQRSIQGSAAKKYIYETLNMLTRREYLDNGTFKCTSVPYVLKSVKNQNGDLRCNIIGKDGASVNGYNIPFSDMMAIGKELTGYYSRLHNGTAIYLDEVNSGLNRSQSEHDVLINELRGSQKLVEAGYRFDECLKATAHYAINNVFDPRNDEKVVRNKLMKFVRNKVFKVDDYADIARKDTLMYLKSIVNKKYAVVDKSNGRGI